MRRTANPAITPQMYRHFATVTVVLTLAVAFFANGENEQASAAQAAASRPPAEERLAKPEKPTFHRAMTDARVDGGVWGSDDNEGFGQPTMEVPSSGSEWMSRPIDAMPGDDEEAGDGAEKAGAPPTPTAEQIAAAEAASRLRSGSAGRD